MKRQVERIPLFLRLTNGGLALAAVGGALCLIVGAVDRESFMSAYLIAFCYWLSLSLGCLTLALIHGMTGGGWGNMVRRIMDAGYETTPFMAFLFIPIGVGMPLIYRWTDSVFVASHESLVRKSGYLNPPGFWCRAVAYFVIWIVLVTVLQRFARHTKPTDEFLFARRLQRVSGWGFMAYGFSYSLASVDWMMSIEPMWYSTMYPLIQIAGHGVAGLSLLIIVSFRAQRVTPSYSMVSEDRLNDFGNLMLASVMFWAYCAFFQYLIIWNGNLPEETVWYGRRLANGWQVLALGLAIFHFAIPFALLLSKTTKRSHRSLCLIGGLLLILHYVDLYWTIMPALSAPRFSPARFVLYPFLTWATIGAAWFSVFAWRLSSSLSDRVTSES